MPVDPDDAEAIYLDQALDRLDFWAGQLSQPAYAYALWMDVVLALLRSDRPDWVDLVDVVDVAALVVVRELQRAL